MKEAEFDARYQDTLLGIEDAVDSAEVDLDIERSGDVLTVVCPDGSQVIISRQVANQQLWVAARSGGYHFAWNPGQEEWQLTRNAGQSLNAALQEIFQDQARVHIDFD